MRRGQSWSAATKATALKCSFKMGVLVEAAHTCVCKNNAPPVLQRMPRRLSQCCTEGLSTFRKPICGDPFQCWGCRPAAGRKFSPNMKERLFCKPPHHPMLKQDKCLCALARLAKFLPTYRCRALHNIEEEGGRTVSEVGERYFCKHKYWIKTT